MVDKDELHSENGFLAVQPGSRLVSMNTVMSNGFATVEEGFVENHRIKFRLLDIGRLSFSRDLPVHDVRGRAPTALSAADPRVDPAGLEDAGVEARHADSDPRNARTHNHHLHQDIPLITTDKSLLHIPNIPITHATSNSLFQLTNNLDYFTDQPRQCKVR